MNNEDLKNTVSKEESELKELVVDFVGNKLNPETNEVTVEAIVEVFAEEFPEFLLAVAEENWINGYTQALNDVDFVKKRNNEKIPETQNQK